MEQIADKITPDMLGNVEAYTTAMVVEKWIDVAWEIICILFLLAVIWAVIYWFIKDCTD